MKKKSINSKLQKKAFSRKSTEIAIKMCKKMIKNKRARQQAIVFIKAIDGKQIRNTSGT